MLAEEETVPPLPHRRADDSRIDAIERQLGENTQLTTELKVAVAALDAKIDPLLEMKTTLDAHIKVICTYARWARNVLLFVVTIILPAAVAAKELGWWPF